MFSKLDFRIHIQIENKDVRLRVQFNIKGLLSNYIIEPTLSTSTQEIIQKILSLLELRSIYLLSKVDRHYRDSFGGQVV